jgi:hypothetical protein
MGRFDSLKLVKDIDGYNLRVMDIIHQHFRLYHLFIKINRDELGALCRNHHAEATRNFHKSVINTKHDLIFTHLDILAGLHILIFTHFQTKYCNIFSQR